MSETIKVGDTIGMLNNGKWADGTEGWKMD